MTDQKSTKPLRSISAVLFCLIDKSDDIVLCRTLEKTILKHILRSVMQYDKKREVSLLNDLREENLLDISGLSVYH